MFWIYNIFVKVLCHFCHGRRTSAGEQGQAALDFNWRVCAERTAASLSSWQLLSTGWIRRICFFDGKLTAQQMKSMWESVTADVTPESKHEQHSFFLSFIFLCVRVRVCRELKEKVSVYSRTIQIE